MTGRWNRQSARVTNYIAPLPIQRDEKTITPLYITMPPFQPLAAVWSQSARRDQPLKTPEPLFEAEAQPPNAPRPRFRIKRRNVTGRNAPTEQFLASVAAADVPIPSIEEPRVLDEDMVDSLSQFSDIEDGSYMGDAPERMFSPPKTPAPGAVRSLSPKQYPNWSLESTMSSLESSPDYESSRPSTAHSTRTSTSFFSTFSISSEDLSQYVSPDIHQDAHFPDFIPMEDMDKTIRAQPHTTSGRKSKKAPWTKPMSQHLWSTYMMYLQDPKVTPFRLSKGGIPPPGVCSRVARESKRSWKGSKVQLSTDNIQSSLTPTGRTSTTYVQWPHSHAATRAHLLELCRLNARTAVRDHQYLAHSPTPFGKRDARLYNRFSGQDMAMSLAVSTSESMQLHGPLAQLTSSQPDPHTEELPPPRMGGFALGVGFEPLESERAQLASPFVARSYGPSSSSVPSSFAPPSELYRRQHHTDGPRRLGSPVRLIENRSTQKRRSGQVVAGEPRRIKRPSLGSDLWIDPSTDNHEPGHSLHIPEFRSAIMEEKKNTDLPTNIEDPFEAPPPETPKKPRAPPPVEGSAQLGSPFALTGSSLSFPNRLYNAPGVDIGTVRRPFATMQQLTNNGTPVRSSLTSRIAQLDERLREIRRQESRGRSESPL